MVDMASAPPPPPQVTEVVGNGGGVVGANTTGTEIASTSDAEVAALRQRIDGEGIRNMIAMMQFSLLQNQNSLRMAGARAMRVS